MRTAPSLFALLFAAGALAPASAFGGALDGPAGKPTLTKAADFQLLDHAGRAFTLSRQADKDAVILYAAATDCETTRSDFAALAALAAEHPGVRLALLASDARDSREAVAAAMKDAGAALPVLIDDTGLVAASLGMAKTGEAIVINPADWTMTYRGAVVGPDGETFLEDAVAALTNDAPVTAAITPAAGRPIEGHATVASADYAKDIVPILAKSCVPCHSQGNIGPFTMGSHRQVKGWSEMIRETIMTKRMPPWHADPHYSAFANDSSLSPEETRTLVAWIDAGAPQGEGEDPLPAIAEQKAAKSEWGLGAPDLVVEMPTAEVIPATGVFDYRYQNVAVDLDEDKWVSGIEYVPGNREVLHHAIIFVKYPDHLAHMQPEWHGGAGGYYAAYVPGKIPMMYPANAGQLLPKGSTIVFQLHYTATGKEETDQSKIGLHFHDAKPELPIEVKSAVEQRFRIEPGQADAPATAVYRFASDALLYSMSPHMHLRGSRFAYKAIYPDGKEEVLLSVPNYDFNWQTDYTLAEPKMMPKGTRIVCEGAFDNSPLNPSNPDPTQRVRWGDQSWEEMFIGFMTYSPLGGGEEAAPAVFEGPITAESIVGTEWRFMRFNLFFDKDGVVLVDNSLKGRWEFTEEGTIRVRVAGRSFDLVIDGSNLSVEGRPLALIG